MRSDVSQPQKECGVMHALSKLPRVFVVDDEPIIASTLATILRLSDFNATSFTEPLEALRAALSDSPDLLISDVVMPSLNGIALATELKAICPNCGVLLFSGQAATVGLVEAALADGNDFEVLAKPVHPADLIKTIQTILGTSNPPKSPILRTIEQTQEGVASS
jgi:DNA-binding NtrC family response regulator